MKHHISISLTLALSCQSVLGKTSSAPLHCASSGQILTAERSCHTSKDSTDEIYTPINQHSSDVLVDTSEHDPTPYFPWTHKPICYNSPKDEVPKLCIYTNASFSNGRGISIFTTPSLAKEFSQLPAFTDPSALSQANTKLNDRRSYVKSIPKKGKGRLASRSLKRGELITATSPLLVVYTEDKLSSKDREFYLRKGIEQLNRKSRELYEGGAKIYGDERVKTQDVLKANTFGLHVGGMEHSKLSHDTYNISGWGESDRNVWPFDMPRPCESMTNRWLPRDRVSDIHTDNVLSSGCLARTCEMQSRLWTEVSDDPEQLKSTCSWHFLVLNTEWIRKLWFTMWMLLETLQKTRRLLWHVSLQSHLIILAIGKHLKPETWTDCAW